MQRAEHSTRRSPLNMRRSCFCRNRIPRRSLEFVSALFSSKKGSRLLISIALVHATNSRIHSLASVIIRRDATGGGLLTDMRLSRLKWMWMPLAIMVFITGMLVARQTRRVDQNALKSAEKSTEWLSYGHGYSEQRYSTLKLIDTTNV